jgi:hypothetical protein
MSDIRVDDRIMVDPATDLFMQGVTYGRVTKVGRKYVTFVSTGLRGQGRTFRLPMDRVSVVPSAAWLV